MKDLNKMSFDEIQNLSEEIKEQITKEQFVSYEKVRQSGVTNMFNVSLVCKLSGLTRSDCYYIMENYDNLNKLYPDVTTTDYPKTIGIVNLEGF